MIRNAAGAEATPNPFFRTLDRVADKVAKIGGAATGGFVGMYGVVDGWDVMPWLPSVPDVMQDQQTVLSAVVAASFAVSTFFQRGE